MSARQLPSQFISQRANTVVDGRHFTESDDAPTEGGNADRKMGDILAGGDEVTVLPDPETVPPVSVLKPPPHRPAVRRPAYKMKITIPGVANLSLDVDEYQKTATGLGVLINGSEVPDFDPEAGAKFLVELDGKVYNVLCYGASFRFEKSDKTVMAFVIKDEK